MNRQRSYAPTGYSQAFRDQHERAQAERAAESEAAREANERIKQERERKLEAERKAKLDEAEAAFDAEIAPEKLRLRRQWLADHPGRSERDFDKEAWPHLRENLKDQAQAEAREAMRQSLLRSGNYAGF